MRIKAPVSTAPVSVVYYPRNRNPRLCRQFSAGASIRTAPRRPIPAQQTQGVNGDENTKTFPGILCPGTASCRCCCWPAAALMSRRLGHPPNGPPWSRQTCPTRTGQLISRKRRPPRTDAFHARVRGRAHHHRCTCGCDSAARRLRLRRERPRSPRCPLQRNDRLGLIRQLADRRTLERMGRSHNQRRRTSRRAETQHQLHERGNTPRARQPNPAQRP